MVGRSGEGLVMHGLAKMPRVNPGTVLNNPSLAPVMSEADRLTFSALPAAELWDLEHKYDASIDACFGPGRFKLSCAMVGLVVLHWRREAVPMAARLVNLRERRDLLPAFMKDPGVFYESDDPSAGAMPSADDYLAVLGDMPTLEIDGGVDFEAAARACLDFLRSPRG
jgi:HprK-related kinase B